MTPAPSVTAMAEAEDSPYTEFDRVALEIPHPPPPSRSFGSFAELFDSQWTRVPVTLAAYGLLIVCSYACEHILITPSCSCRLKIGTVVPCLPAYTSSHAITLPRMHPSQEL